MFVSVSHVEHMRKAWNSGACEALFAKAQGKKQRTFEEWLADEEKRAGPPIARF